MLIVKTYIDKSKIHNIGLFASELIKKDTIVWRMSKLDMILDKDEFEKLPQTAKNFITNHGVWDINEQKIIMSFDNDKFINHSLTPNLSYNRLKKETFANKDIYPDEEITINYYDFDESAKSKLENK